MSIESELAKRDRLLAAKSARIRELEAQLGGGKLTAEQVRELIAPHLHARPTFDFGHHGAVWSADFQAIADELNAALGGGECEDANTRFNAWVCSECKATLLLMFDDYDEPTYSVDGVADIPRFCPNCGKKVKR